MLRTPIFESSGRPGLAVHTHISGVFVVVNDLLMIASALSGNRRYDCS